MSDGAPKAEEASGQRIQMDWIDIAGDGGVAAPDIAGDAPDGGERPPTPTLRREGGGRFRGGGGFGAVGRCAMQVGARFGPDGVTIDRGLGEHVELPSAGMLPQVGRRNTEAQALVGAERARLSDPVR